MDWGKIGAIATIIGTIVGGIGLIVAIFFGIKSLSGNSGREKVQKQKHKIVKDKNINQKMNSKDKSSSQEIKTKYTEGGDINQEMDI